MASDARAAGDVIVDLAQPCAKCGEPAHLVLKEGRRLCARCYKEERKPTPPAA